MRNKISFVDKLSFKAFRNHWKNSYGPKSFNDELK